MSALRGIEERLGEGVSREERSDRGQDPDDGDRHKGVPEQ